MSIAHAVPSAAPLNGEQGVTTGPTLDGRANLVARERAGQALYLCFCALQLHSFAISWLVTHRWPALVYALIILLEAALTAARKPPSVITSSRSARGLAAIGTFGPLFMRAGGVRFAPDLLAGGLIATGLTISTLGLLSLRRRFSIVPANRGIVQGGLYRWIRHPLYAGYILSHCGLLLAYPTRWNLGCLLVADGAQLGRIRAEEQLLARDEAYCDYQRQVRWRLVPGLF